MSCRANIAFLTFFLLLFAAACGRSGSDTDRILITGSDTEVNLVQALAEAYMQENPEISITVNGGGSGTGIAAIINLQTDIANSSREMSESELGQARASGVEPVAIPFAVDGLAIIVHEENPVRELTLEQLGGIFAGRITNWNELGGPDREITLYGRQSNSGTYVFFRDRVVQGEYSRRMMNMNGTAQIVEAVRNDRSGAGYVGIGYIVDPQGEPISGIGVVNIASAEEEPAVSPLQRENVEQGVYPISRPLYQYVNGLEDERLIDFIRFELGSRGQQIVAGSGYYPLGGELVEENRQRGILP